MPGTTSGQPPSGWPAGTRGPSPRRGSRMPRGPTPCCSTPRRASCRLRSPRRSGWWPARSPPCGSCAGSGYPSGGCSSRRCSMRYGTGIRRSIALALLVAGGPVAASLAVGLKLYAGVPLLGRWRDLVIALIVLLVTLPLVPWQLYLDQGFGVGSHLQTAWNGSAWRSRSSSRSCSSGSGSSGAAGRSGTRSRPSSRRRSSTTSRWPYPRSASGGCSRRRSPCRWS